MMLTRTGIGTAQESHVQTLYLIVSIPYSELDGLDSNYNSELEVYLEIEVSGFLPTFRSGANTRRLAEHRQPAIPVQPPPQPRQNWGGGATDLLSNQIV
jgi:hypothetical protein